MPLHSISSKKCGFWSPTFSDDVTLFTVFRHGSNLTTTNVCSKVRYEEKEECTIYNYRNDQSET